MSRPNERVHTLANNVTTTPTACSMENPFLRPVAAGNTINNLARKQTRETLAGALALAARSAAIMTVATKRLCLRRDVCRSFWLSAARRDANGGRAAATEAAAAAAEAAPPLPLERLGSVARERQAPFIARFQCTASRRSSRRRRQARVVRRKCVGGRSAAAAKNRRR